MFQKKKRRPSHDHAPDRRSRGFTSTMSNGNNSGPLLLHGGDDTYVLTPAKAVLTIANGVEEGIGGARSVYHSVIGERPSDNQTAVSDIDDALADHYRVQYIPARQRASERSVKGLEEHVPLIPSVAGDEDDFEAVSVNRLAPKRITCVTFPLNKSRPQSANPIVPRLNIPSKSLFTGLNARPSVDYGVISPEPPWYDNNHRVRWTEKLMVIVKVIVALLACAGIAYAFIHKDVAVQWISQSVSLRTRLGWATPFIFFFVYTACATLFIPAEILTLCSGFIFCYDAAYHKLVGVILAFVVSEIGMMTAALILFMICRLWIKDKIMPWVEKFQYGHTFMEVIVEGGWPLAILVRLAPLTPFAVGSLLMSLTDLSFRIYFWSILANIPFTLFFIWVGSDADDLQLILEGNPLQSTSRLVLIGIGAVIMICIVGYLAYLMRTHFDSATARRRESLRRKHWEAQFRKSRVNYPRAHSMFDIRAARSDCV